MNKLEIWAVALIYLGFFGMIGFSIWQLETAWPLWALIFLPAIRTGKGTEDGEE